MIFTVLWVRAAERNLTALWLASPDRDAMTSAANTIDRLLTRDPESRGELLFDTVRTLSIPPLGVDFEVIEADRLVYVLTVWDTTKGKPS